MVRDNLRSLIILFTNNWATALYCINMAGTVKNYGWQGEGEDGNRLATT